MGWKKPRLKGAKNPDFEGEPSGVWRRVELWEAGRRMYFGRVLFRAFYSFFSLPSRGEQRVPAAVSSGSPGQMAAWSGGGSTWWKEDGGSRKGAAVGSNAGQ